MDEGGERSSRMHMNNPVGKSARRNWTALEVTKLRKHAQAKSPISLVQAALQRSKSSLRQKAHELGIPLGHRRKSDPVHSDR
jgi:hypothetical protein